MPCYAPVTLYKSSAGPNPETGKWPLVARRSGYIDRPQQVPCGRCIGCRLERARQWAIRCMHESELHEQNSFITLTYRPNELIYGGNLTGTLVPRHLTLFWKRLRKEYGDGIRYFACGEYGDQYNRPHYHAALFGLDFQDKRLLKTTANGDNLYTSDSLDSLWTHGDTIIGALTFESASYVARYIMDKKLGNQKEYYEQQGIEPEFVRMSRRPGLGTGWYDKYRSDLYPHGYAVIRGGIKSSIPRFYNNKYEISHPIQFKKLKLKRLDAMSEQWRENTPYRLRVRERIKNTQIRNLKRNME